MRSCGNRLEIHELYTDCFGLFNLIGEVLDELLLDCIKNLTRQHVMKLCSRLDGFEIEWIK